MQFNVVEISTSEKEVEIKFEYAEVKDDIDKEVKKESKKLQIPGFRKGKVPANMIKKFYGDALEYEASEKVANNKFWDVADKQELKPIGRPTMTDIKFEPGKELSFKVKYEVVPNLELKDYNNLTLEIPEFIAKDDEVEKEIDYILESNATNEPTEIVGEDTNFILDVEAVRIDDSGNAFEDSKPEKFHLHLNDEKVQPEIKEKAKGKKIGDSFDFSFKNETEKKDESGKAELVSEEFKYLFKILEIKKVIYPELTEEFIKKITKDKVSTEDELKESIKKDIQSYYDQRMEEITRGKIISEIVKNNDFIPPSSLVSNVLEEYVKNEEEQAKKNKSRFFNKEEAKQRLHKSAENEVKWYLIKNQIIKNEKIEVSDQDLMELAQKESEKTGLPVEKLINYFKSSGHLERSLDEKLFQYLKSNNNISKVDPAKFNKKDEETNE